MSGEDEEQIEIAGDAAEEDAPGEFIIDILTGEKERPTAKKLVVQKVLRLLIESYGFDRHDLEVDYNPQISEKKRMRIDIAVFRPGTGHTNENLQRIIVCRPQKRRDKLRTLGEAEVDLADLKNLMATISGATLGMWTNGYEEFLIQIERGRFEDKFRPLGVWPVPGERTVDLDRTGGVIQVSAETENLQDALLRCRQYLNRNRGLDHKDSFKQLAVLMLAKMYDETLSSGDRRFWIRGDEPFSEAGQKAITQRISETISAAKVWQPNVLARGWDLTLEAHETARVVMELARYSLSETQPRYRTEAFRAVARTVMDGREGRYPTPLNVAEMAVEMLDPKPGERVMDCCSGTGTFLAMTAVHIFKKKLMTLGATPATASAEQLRQAQRETAVWVAGQALGCEIDPFLAVTSRMNLLFTIGSPGRVFRLDARAFPDGDLDGLQEARPAMALGTMDVLLLNPWFSTQDLVNEVPLLQRYQLGHTWMQDEDGGYRNTGNLNLGGIPPEVLFIERALQWVKPGTGRVGVLLPDGLLGNPSDEYVRWWILRHCEVLASVDLPVEPFKVAVKEYGLTPALPSFLILRRRSQEELIRTEHPEYKVFMAVVARAGEDTRGPLFQRSPDGEILVFSEDVIERVRNGNQIEIRKGVRKNRRLHDELPLVAEKYREFLATGSVNL